VVIEDLISTGKSSLLVIEVLQKAGFQVEGLVSIFNYGFAEARDSFEKAKVSCQSLTDYDSLITLAIEKKIVTSADQNTLLNWRSDPAGWSAKFVNS
jgi:orotate phosphoribosyltransferase